MTLNRTHLASAALALALAACSSPKPGTPEFVQKKEEDQQKAVVKTVEQSLSVTPDWYKKNPVDVNSLYAKATATSNIRQFAVDKAKLLARKDLAETLGNRVSSIISDYIRESGGAVNDEVSQSVKSVGQSVTLDQNLAGYVLENDHVEAEGKEFRAYVMLRYPIGEVNKVVASQVKKNAVLEIKLEDSEAWKQLEKEIEAAKKK
jgi:hypothetical protein